MSENLKIRLPDGSTLDTPTVSVPGIGRVYDDRGAMTRLMAAEESVATLEGGVYFSVSGDPSVYDNKLSRLTTPNAAYRIDSGAGWTDLPENFDNTCVLRNTQFMRTNTLQTIYPYSKVDISARNNFRQYWRIVNTQTGEAYTPWHADGTSYAQAAPASYGNLLANVIQTNTVYYMSAAEDWTDKPSQYGGVLINLRSYSSGVLQVWFDYLYNAENADPDMCIYWRFVLNDGTVYMPWQGGSRNLRQTVDRLAGGDALIGLAAQRWTSNLEGSVTVGPVAVADCPGFSGDGLRVTLTADNIQTAADSKLLGVRSPAYPKPVVGQGYRLSCWAKGTAGARFRMALHTTHVDDFTLPDESWHEYSVVLPFLSTDSKWDVRFLLFGSRGDEVTVCGWALTPCDNGYVGKRVSILGDSISTYRNLIPAGNVTYYPGASDVDSQYRTWWKKSLINGLGMQLLVNNSWSGRCVTTVRDTETKLIGSGGCNQAEIEKLSRDGIDPDVIIVRLGINDLLAGWNVGMRMGTYDGHKYNAVPDGTNEGESGLIMPTDTTKFRDAYAIMLGRIAARYPYAEVWCCTCTPIHRRFGFPGNRDEDGDFSAPNWADINQAIIEIAGLFGYKVMRHDKCGITYWTRDYFYDWDDPAGLDGDTGLHPNAAGHILMARQTMRDMIGDAGWRG